MMTALFCLTVVLWGGSGKTSVLTSQAGSKQLPGIAYYQIGYFLRQFL